MHSADEALAVIAREAGPIHLVLTDVVMPNMGGMRLAARLEQIRPGIKVLFMSGYGEEIGGRPGPRRRNSFHPEAIQSTGPRGQGPLPAPSGRRCRAAAVGCSHQSCRTPLRDGRGSVPSRAEPSRDREGVPMARGLPIAMKVALCGVLC